MTEKTDIRDSDEKVVEIEMERLRTFMNHPFKVIGDSQMIELQDSIKNLLISATPYQWKHMIRQRTCRRNTKETRYVMLKIWEQLLEQTRELFSDCGPFCMNGGCEKGKMICGKSIPPQMLPTDIIRVDFPKLCEESVLEEGVPDEDTAD